MKVSPNTCGRLLSKLLSIRINLTPLITVYPYKLSGNMHSPGNIASHTIEFLVVIALINKLFV